MRSSLLRFALIVFAAATLHGQNLILNGSFETPVISNPGSSTPDVGPTYFANWTNAGGTGSHIGLTGNGTFPNASAGSQYLFVGNSGAAASIAQTVALTAGQAYTLTFDESGLTNFNKPARIDLTVSDGSQTLNQSYTLTANTNAWVGQIFSFTANDTASYTFTFASPGPDGTNFTNLDNVSLTAIPEPSVTALLTAFALGATVLVKRHRLTAVHS